MTNPEAVKKEIHLERDAGAFHLISFQRQDGHFSRRAHSLDLLLLFCQEKSKAKHF
jgi:hypothetical protein